MMLTSMLQCLIDEGEARREVRDEVLRGGVTDFQSAVLEAFRV